MPDWKPFFCAALLTAFSTCAQASDGAYPTDETSLTTGRALAETYCGVCHAIGKEDKSAQEGAPAFRDLSARYPLESLEEPLAEGIVTAHESMPELSFEPDDIDAFLGYLSSIQTK